jgi:hypothetical protein
MTTKITNTPGSPTRNDGKDGNTHNPTITDVGAASENMIPTDSVASAETETHTPTTIDIKPTTENTMTTYSVSSADTTKQTPTTISNDNTMTINSVSPSGITS